MEEATTERKHIVSEHVESGKNEWFRTEGEYTFETERDAMDFVSERNAEYAAKGFKVLYQYEGFKRPDENKKERKTK